MDDPPSPIDASMPDLTPQKIGNYDILETLGEGGFGVVYLAEQFEPLRRHVAIKVIKPGMDTGHVLARFEAERQALAMMDHPNIAKVLDAGATETGRPYFVMELVKGVPITEYCDQENLTLAERLRLFVMTSRAVQHAHQKGIIHRDIKPSNVLVATQDGHPAPKVIDFGIAKATSARLTEQTIFTEQGLLVGTPEYMSPEQADLNELDIDTRSDVYSLGVLLYELLTGTTPFESIALRRAGLAEIQRIIREEEPPRPSTRLSALATTPPEQGTSGVDDATINAASISPSDTGRASFSLEAIARHRRTDPKTLGRTLRGDVDWIIMKAMEKDRGRRYETANELATDIERYLDGQPVVAAPPSALYRATKFTRRHRGAVVTVALVGASMVVGTVAFAWQAQVAQTQRDAAEEGRIRAVAAEREVARRADQLAIVADFQASMLGQVDPTAAGQMLSANVAAKLEAALEPMSAEQGDTLDAFVKSWANINATDVARELIDHTILTPAVEAIDTQFTDQPVVEAQLRQVLADRYEDLGLYDAAMPLQTAAFQRRRDLLGNEHPDTLESMDRLGQLLVTLGRLDEAEPIVRESLEIRQRVLPADDPLTLQGLLHLGGLLRDQNKLDEAEAYFLENLAGCRRVLGDADIQTISAIANMGQFLHAQRRLDEAEPYLREAVDLRRRALGEDDTSTLIAVGNLGNLLRDMGRLEEAEPYLREAMDKRRRLLGEEHMLTLNSINNMAVLLRTLGRLDEAEPYLRETYEALERVLGPDHFATLVVMSNLGGLLQEQGKNDEAEPIARTVLERRLRILGAEHRSTLISVQTLGAVLIDLGKPAEAIELMEPRRPAFEAVFTGADIGLLATTQLTLARAYLATDDFAMAEADVLRAHNLVNDGQITSQTFPRDLADLAVDLYTRWHAAAPDNDYDQRAAEWAARRDEIDANDQ